MSGDLIAWAKDEVTPPHIRLYVVEDVLALDVRKGAGWMELVPFDLCQLLREQVTDGAMLSVRHVVFSDDLDGLMPEWLKFVEGIVGLDSPSCP